MRSAAWRRASILYGLACHAKGTPARSFGRRVKSNACILKEKAGRTDCPHPGLRIRPRGLMHKSALWNQNPHRAFCLRRPNPAHGRDFLVPFLCVSRERRARWTNRLPDGTSRIHQGTRTIPHVKVLRADGSTSFPPMNRYNGPWRGLCPRLRCQASGHALSTNQVEDQVLSAKSVKMLSGHVRRGLLSFMSAQPRLATLVQRKPTARLLVTAMHGLRRTDRAPRIASSHDARFTRPVLIHRMKCAHAKQIL